MEITGLSSAAKKFWNTCGFFARCWSSLKIPWDILEAPGLQMGRRAQFETESYNLKLVKQDIKAEYVRAKPQIYLGLNFTTWGGSILLAWLWSFFLSDEEYKTFSSAACNQDLGSSWGVLAFLSRGHETKTKVQFCAYPYIMLCKWNTLKSDMEFSEKKRGWV